MPYSRPTLTQLRTTVAADIAAALGGTDPLLRFSNLGIMGTAQAGLAHLHYGYLDWISKQAVPYTATGEYLEAWGALKGVFRKDATAAGGQVILSGVVGKPISAGTNVVRGDGRIYTIQVSVTIGGDGTAIASVIDQATGAAGNCAAGTVMSLSMPIAGVQSNGVAAAAFTGGADVELDDDFRGECCLPSSSLPKAGTRATTFAGRPLYLVSRVPGARETGSAPARSWSTSCSTRPMPEAAGSRRVPMVWRRTSRDLLSRLPGIS